VIHLAAEECFDGADDDADYREHDGSVLNPGPRGADDLYA
jgi:hypothetical protein